MIHNGVDPQAVTSSPSVRAEVRRGWGVDGGQVLYGFVGRMHDQKNPLFFIDVADRVARTDPVARFAMIGHGPLMDRVGREIRARGLSDRFVHIGPLSEAATLRA